MNDQTDIGNKDFSWGEIKVSPSSIPEVSLFALAQRGFTHVLGNEVASALTAWKKTEEGNGADEAAIKAWVDAKRQAKLEQILEGKLGVRVASAGPRVSGVEAIMRAIATERVKARLAARKGADGKPLKLPTGDHVIEVAGKAMDRGQLIEAELRFGQVAKTLKDGTIVPSIREEAERRMAQAGVGGEGDEEGELFE